jgi:type 1 glutamine amidotransferase
MTRSSAAAAALAATAFVSLATAEPPIRALIVTGHNNHDWQYTSHLHKDTLEATGRFTVDITDTPETTLADAKGLQQYQVIVLDYNDSQSPRRWGDAAEKTFIDVVGAGTGVVSVHSADNAFKGWTEYEKMLGLMWRDGTGHGQFHEFKVEWTDRDHPITNGLANFGAHPDELYHKLVNSQNAKFHLLGQAYSDPASGGTGQNEPMAFTLEFGKARIFATPLGHTWTNSPETKVSIVDPNFKILLCRGAEWAATGKVTLPPTWSDTRAHNVLSDKEKAGGWTLLFDGKSGAGWRGFKKDAFPVAGWTVKDGVLWKQPGPEGSGGDIITSGEYGDFEFACDWNISKGGNSGIIYRCTEDHDYCWETGPEMQILDDVAHADGKNEKTRAGTLYAIFPCAVDVARPPGEWNHARVVVKGSHIEHWLNGFKVVDCDLTSEDYKKAHDASKWTGMPDFGKRSKGHIALQDHGDEVRFRDIKVRKPD